MKWRFIGPETWDAAMNAALDEICMGTVGSGESPPTVRFYEWSPSAIVIGYFQKIHDEVDVEKCKEKNVHIVRRISGGGSMYLDTEGEITYSFIVPQHMLPNDVNECYRNVCQHVVNALASVGINAEFKPINDILVDGKKISGSALTRRSGSVMVHGTLLYDISPEMFGLLKVSGEKMSDKLAAEDRVTCITKHSTVTKDDMKKALIAGFADGKDTENTSWTPMEINNARDLAEDKYCSDKWTFRR
jgi:lipoate---protein ligase